METLRALCLLCMIGINAAKYSIPEVKIEALSPIGIRVSIPDDEGVRRFAFHAKVNKQLVGKEEGTINGDTTQSTDGRWIVRDNTVTLIPGDLVYYWVFVQNGFLGFHKENQIYEVKSLVDANTVLCLSTDTTVNGGKPTCSRQLIFENDFKYFDNNKWRVEHYIPNGPDYEFNTYEDRNENVNTLGDYLHIKPTFRLNPEDQNLNLSDKCTAEIQSRQHCQLSVQKTILPPVISAQISSKFSFKYGKVEVLAQLPMGDWIYPQLYLEPYKYEYGNSEYESGRIWLAYARGNENLKSSTDNDIGNNLLYHGPVLGKKNPLRQIALKTIRGNHWSAEPHNFTMVWTKEKFVFYVDGVHEQEIYPPNGRFSSLNLEHAVNWLSPMSPFDKEFILRFGVGVGGIVDFPDGSSSSGVNKPWQNNNPKSSLLFYESRNSWKDSWTQAELKLKSVKVWAV